MRDIFRKGRRKRRKKRREREREKGGMVRGRRAKEESNEGTYRERRRRWME